MKKTAHSPLTRSQIGSLLRDKKDLHRLSGSLPATTDRFMEFKYRKLSRKGEKRMTLGGTVD